MKHLLNWDTFALPSSIIHMGWIIIDSFSNRFWDGLFYKFSSCGGGWLVSHLTPSSPLSALPYHWQARTEHLLKGGVCLETQTHHLPLPPPTHREHIFSHLFSVSIHSPFPSIFDDDNVTWIPHSCHAVPPHLSLACTLCQGDHFTFSRSDPHPFPPSLPSLP